MSQIKAWALQRPDKSIAVWSITVRRERTKKAAVDAHYRHLRTNIGGLRDGYFRLWMRMHKEGFRVVRVTIEVM